MSLKPYPYRPTGGLNGEDAEDQLGPEEVQSSANFLFERHRFLNRPYAGVHPIIGFTGNFDFAHSLRFDAFAPLTVGISSNGKLYKISNVNATEITGPGTTFAAFVHHNLEAVNGVVLIANNTGGMLRWDPTGTVYIVMDATHSNYRYITSHLFRAVGAYKLDGAASDARRMGWSQSGDETLWTGADSGTVNLVDAPDDITGLEVLYNTLVVCRRGGFTLGFPTYTSLPVYRFETWGRELCHGVHYDSTLGFMDNILYYCSPANVCTFDLQKISFIGDKIRRELFSYLKRGIMYRGFCSRTAINTALASEAPVRAQYHLVPMANVSTYPHFVYDIAEQSWSRHTYDYPVRGGFYSILDETGEAPAILSGGGIGGWTTDAPCEADAYLVSRSITLEAEELDAIVRRVLLKYRNHGFNVVTTTVRARTNDTLSATVDPQGIGTSSADGKLIRRWFNHAQAGQGFEIKLDVPKGVLFEGTYLGLMYDTSGEFKGDAGA